MLRRLSAEEESLAAQSMPEELATPSTDGLAVPTSTDVVDVPPSTSSDVLEEHRRSFFRAYIKTLNHGFPA